MIFQIVVARYNEDISYLIPFANVCIIYNKGDDNIPVEFTNIIYLPNIGRESHTYLYHIINNYNNIAHNTIFIQGNIKDHRLLDFKDYIKNKDFTGHLSENNIMILKSNINHKGKYLKDLKNGLLKKSIYTPFHFINDILAIDLRKEHVVNIVWGANFSVSKSLIQNKPIDYYKSIIKYVEYHNNPEEGHYFERSWYLIFKYQKFIYKKTIMYHFNSKAINYYNNSIHLPNKNLNLDNISQIHIWISCPKEISTIDKPIIKYINNLQYIEIFPYIKDNSFEIKISNNLYIYFEFYNDKYELHFENNNVHVYHYNTDKIIMSVRYKKKLKYNPIKFSWTNDYFTINNILEFPIQLFGYISVYKIMVCGENSFIDYSIDEKLYNNKIFYFYSYNIYTTFYLNNYLDYYTIEYK